MSHSSGSFDYKVIHPEIKRVLKARSVLDNTVQVAMPFIKATTTIQLPKTLGDGNIGFTLGIHAMDKDLSIEDIFSAPTSTMLSARRTNMPLVGYTYTPSGTPEPIYAIDANQDDTTRIFDKQASLYTNTAFVRVPPPGITSVNISRMKSGRVGLATLNITVPSLVQLETLHRTFLIPGVGMVVEWGQQFAVESLTTDVTGELPDVSYGLFPWHDRRRLLDLIDKLAVNKYGLKNVLEEYVYPTQGQYMWMFGRVANFNVTGKDDGSFECTVKVVGPAEDAWAYSTKNTIVPAKDPSSQFFCASNTNSVYSYLTETVLGFNLKTLLDERIKDGNPWSKHIVKFKQSKTDKGEPTSDNTEQSNTSQKTFADSEDAYFMSWRFFVNVVLNDPEDGILGIFKKANLSTVELEKIGLLRPYSHGPNRETTDVSTVKYVDDPLESFVGANKYLRSIDPSTLIIVNEKAVELAIANPQYNIVTSAAETFKASNESRKMLEAGDFTLSTAAPAPGLVKYVSDASNPDKGFLSTGVWISHKAVIEAMISGDTVLRGITNLLDRMNQATSGYWKLSLDVADGDFKQNVGQNYSIIDANSRESSDQAVNKFIDNVHTFNKYVRVDKETQQLVGSELINSSVSLDLPKLLFSQIATMGLVHPEDAQNAGVEVTQGEAPPKSPKLSPDDRLRKMFAVTSLATTEAGVLLKDTEQGPDLTIPPKKERQRLLAANSCGATNTNTAAQTSGEGNKAGPVPLSEDYKDKSSTDLKSDLEKATAESKSQKCQSCQSCKTIPVPPTPPTPEVVDQVVQSSTSTVVSRAICDTLSGKNERFVCNYAYNAGITNPTELAAFLAQCKQESGDFTVVSENLNYTTAKAILGTFRNISPDTVQPLIKNPQRLGNTAYANRLGNGDFTSGEGYKYRGRGFIQLTGKANYQAYSKRSGKDVVTNPEVVANDLNLAADVSIDFWKSRVKPNVSNFSDTSTVTLYVNGESRKGLIERDANFKQYIRKFNTGTPVTAPAPPVVVRPSTSPSTGFAAVFVTGLTGSLSEKEQIAAFKSGVGPDKRIFTAQYTNIGAVKQFLASNPKTPVFLYSAGSNSGNVNTLIRDPNVDKQKLFLIEPFFLPPRGDGTRAAVVNAIRNGLPASNVYGGPTPNRGGGEKKIPGTSVTPPGYTHFQAPTYVGQQKASILGSTSTPATPQAPATPPTATTPVAAVPTTTTQVVNKTVVPPPSSLKPAISGNNISWRTAPRYPYGFVGGGGDVTDTNPKTGKKRIPGPPYLKGYQNAELPYRTPGFLIPTNRHPLGKNDTCAIGKCYLIPEAAAQLELLREAAKNAGYRFTVSSAYRGIEQQGGLKEAARARGAQEGGVASPGSSPHGWATAIDISELSGLAKKLSVAAGFPNDSTTKEPNYQCRSNSKLFQWLATYGPLFGWYNPQRLWDYDRAEECWHFEYWGWKYPPQVRSLNQFPTVPPTYGPGVAAPEPGPVPPAGQAPLPPPVSENSSICTDEEYLRISTENSTFGSTFASVEDGKKICDECKRHQAITQQLETVVAEKEKFEVRTREFAGYEQVFRYVEIFPEYMVASITDDADGIRSNAFGASPGTLSISADLVMPGINGIRVGELFWLDRMPAFYRAFGAFQIMNVEDIITVTDGWKTKVHAVFNYMGESWKSSMATKLIGPG